MRFAALIPALDAAGSVGPVVRAILGHVPEVVVVDDGSTDDTAAVAAAAGAEVIRHPVNRGKGAALLTGLRHLERSGATHALTLDADGQHLPEEAPVLLAASRAEPGALVIGSRQVDSDVAPLKRFGNRFADAWVWIASGVRFEDTQSGFRVYPVSAVLGLGLTGERFELETEVVIRAVRASVPVRQVPVRVHYPPPDVRASHYDPFRDTVRIIEMVVGLILRLR